MAGGAATAPVVTIDGPSGSGKGTIARALARQLGWHLLDSGALYRATALAALEAGIDLDREDEVARIAEELDVRFADAGGEERVLLAGRDVSEVIRTERCGEAASKVAAQPAVRRALFERQRAFAIPPGLVADGRDMGTSIFPEAVLKIFLTATAEERARRRYKQLSNKGNGVKIRDLARGIAQRDERDAKRAVAPLAPAADARIIDSTHMRPEEVTARILQWLDEAGVMSG